MDVTCCVIGNEEQRLAAFKNRFSAKKVSYEIIFDEGGAQLVKQTEHHITRSS